MYCSTCEIDYPSRYSHCITCNSELHSGKLCLKCKNPNAESAKSCSFCGAVFQKDFKKILKDNSESLERLYKVCTKCNKTGSRNGIFCAECGGEFTLSREHPNMVFNGPGKPKGILNRLLSLFKIAS